MRSFSYFINAAFTNYSPIPLQSGANQRGAAGTVTGNYVVTNATGYNVRRSITNVFFRLAHPRLQSIPLV